MDYKKLKLLYILTAILFFGCTSNDNEVDTTPPEVSIKNFETSYSQVKIDWELKRPLGVVIEDLTIYRIEKNDESDFYQETQIANLPSNETSFVDNNVPYKTEVSYTVKIIYRDERQEDVGRKELQSEPKKFIREIVKFERVPFQVQKDFLSPNIFHILSKDGKGTLIKYNSSKNSIENLKKFEDGFLLNNKFHIVNNNEIYIADTKGKITKLNTENYKTLANYQVAITENLNAYLVIGNRIYYQDRDNWCIYDIASNFSTKTGYLSNYDYLEYLGQDKTFFMYCDHDFGSIGFVNYTPENCPGFMDCTPVGYFYTTSSVKPNSIDVNLFSWNSDKSKCISTLNGTVFNVSNLTPEIRLYDITGKRYFQFAFDAENNIYATVQGEKKIHKFDSNYKLIQTIETKLYPLFPLVTPQGLKVIGSYEPVSYWSYGYGYSFDFNKCAIETF